MRRAAAGSIVVHGAIALGLLAIPHVDELSPRDEPGIEVLDVGVAKVDSPPDQHTGGGSPTTQVTELPKPTATRDRTVPHRSRPDGDHPMRVADYVGTQSVEARGEGMGTGSGAGVGDGAAGGVCGCELDGLAPPPPAPPPPPPPPPPVASKARKPKLIFPARERETDPDLLFVAMVTIDEDGYVVGAKLVHGRGGAADRRAEELIWRFRYEPARDVDGRAIRTQLEQPFLVQ